MVYIEKIIIVDFLIHYVTFYLTCYLYLKRYSFWRLFIGEIINVGLIFIYIYLTKSLAFMLLGAILVALVSFGGRKRKLCVGEVFLYATLNVTLAGASEVMYLSGLMSSVTLLLLVVVFFVCVIVFSLHSKLSIRDKSLIYEIRMEDKNNIYELNGYLDTGNFMESDSIPVIILATRYKIGEKIKIDTCYTVNGQGRIELYKVDRILIKINKKYREIEAYVGYSNITFDAMFGLMVIKNA